MTAHGTENAWCACMGRVAPARAVRDILDEAVEMLKEPSKDELSDIAYGIGRLIGSLTGRPYVPFPGDALHVRKIEERMREYGCIRSRRHLIGGACPSAPQAGGA